MCMWINSVLILTRRLLCVQESEMHITPDPSSCRTVLQHTVLHAQGGLQTCVMLHMSLGTGQTQPGHCNWGACRQLPLASGNYVTFVALPLPKDAWSSYANILYKQGGILVRKLYSSSNNQKGGTFLHTGDLCNVQRENPSNLTGVHPMLHECRIPTIWRDTRFICYPHSSF